jgi:hypothetical protein
MYYKKIIFVENSLPDGGSKGGEPEKENSPVDCFPGERPAKDGRAGHGSKEGCVHATLHGAVTGPHIRVRPLTELRQSTGLPVSLHPLDAVLSRNC